MLGERTRAPLRQDRVYGVDHLDDVHTRGQGGSPLPAEGRSFGITYGFVLGTFLIAVAAIYLVFESPIAVVMFLALAAALMVRPIKYMPFRVYERGVTMTPVSFRDGLTGREAFVPASEITRVTYEASDVLRMGDVEHFHAHRRSAESFDIYVDTGDHMRVARMLREVLSCEVEGPGGRSS